MNNSLLGHKVSVSESIAVHTPKSVELLNTFIDTVSASKRALCEFLRDNPTAKESDAYAFIREECTAISTVNDHLSIGIPMNSFRFTLKAAADYYFRTIVPESQYAPFRIGALIRFIEDYPEAMLVFPVVAAGDETNVSVGELRFSVNNLYASPHFLQFLLPDLTKVRLFYADDPEVIRAHSEIPK